MGGGINARNRSPRAKHQPTLELQMRTWVLGRRTVREVKFGDAIHRGGAGPRRGGRGDEKNKCSDGELHGMHKTFLVGVKWKCVSRFFPKGVRSKALCLFVFFGCVYKEKNKSDDP